MAKPILVEVECIMVTAVDSEYFEEGHIYNVDMVWAKKRDVWRYFRPLRDVPKMEAEDRIHDEILPEREEADRARAEANEEAEAKLKEEKPKPFKSYPNTKAGAKAKAKARAKARAKASK